MEKIYLDSKIKNFLKDKKLKKKIFIPQKLINIVIE